MKVLKFKTSPSLDCCAGWKKGKRKWLQKSVLLSTSICCVSYSYGVSQPCLYLSLGYFFKKIPSQRRIVIKSYNPVPNNENGRAENWTKSIKLRSYTFQGKFKREYNIYFGELCWQLHFDWEFFVVCFSTSPSPCVCVCVCLGFLSICRTVVFLLKSFPETYFQKIHEWRWFMTVSFKFALVIS